MSSNYDTILIQTASFFLPNFRGNSLITHKNVSQGSLTGYSIASNLRYQRRLPRSDSNSLKFPLYIYITILCSPFLLSGTRSVCPGKMNCVASLFSFVNSEGVVSNLAASDVRVSRSRTFTIIIYFLLLPNYQ